MLSIKKNLIYNSIYQILVIITPLITSPYISRVLGARNLGLYSYNYTIANYFLLFAMLGVTNFGNRSIARVKSSKKKYSSTFWNIYFFQLASTFVSVCIYFLYAFFFSKSNFQIAFVESLVVISAGFDITWFFFGLELFKLTTIRSIVIKIITVAGILLLVHNSGDLLTYCFIMSFGILLNQVLLWMVLKKYVLWIKPNFRQILMNLKPNLILFFPVIAISLYSYLDRIMLGAMSTYTELGYFDNAEKITNIPMSLVTAMGTVMLPRMSYLVKTKNVETEDKLNRISMNFTVIISTALCFGIMGISNNFVPLFFGVKFMPVKTLLLLMAPKMIFISWGNVICSQYLLPYSKDIFYTLSVFCGALINVLINLALIPRMGSVGTAIGSLITELLITILQTVFAWKHMKIVTFIRDSIPFLFLGIFMFVSIVFIKTNSMMASVVLQIITGGGIYSVLGIGFIIFYRKDLLKQFFPNIYDKIINKN